MKNFFGKFSTRILILAAVLAACGISFAWLNKVKNSVDNNIIEGSVVQQYFHCGKGLEDDPFVITRPIHYYHLVELYQRNPDFAAADHYFQLGYDLDGDGELEVYEYDDLGNIVYTDSGHEVPGLSDTLNMAYYSGDYALLPIGSSRVPFNGSYDGSGLTVANLHITGCETVTFSGRTETYKTADMGVFGCLDAGAQVHDAYFDHVTIDMSGADASDTSEGHNTDIHNGKVCAGYIAGHVKTTSSCKNVYINDCTIVGNGSEGSCGYGYFGAVEEDAASPVKVTSLGTDVAAIRKKGHDTGFGGSLDMYSLKTRINSVYDSLNVQNPTSSSYTPKSYYYKEETYVIDELAGTKELTSQSEKTEVTGQNSGSELVNYFYYTSEMGGSYNMCSETDTSRSACLYGASSAYPKTVTTYTYKKEFINDGKDTWYIGFGDSGYLGVNSTNTAVENKTSMDEAVKWLLDSDGNLYYMVYDVPYYLNSDSSHSLVIGTDKTKASVWTRSGDRFHITDGEKKYYLSFLLGEWQLSNSDPYIIGMPDKQHYMKAAEDAITDCAAEEATQWLLSDDDIIKDTTGTEWSYIYTKLSGSEYYLVLDGTALSLSTEPQKWYKDTHGFYCTSGENEKRYLRYEDKWTAAYGAWYLFTDSASSPAHYLSISSTQVYDSPTAESENQRWVKTSDTGSMAMFCLIGGTKYYLGYDKASGSLVPSATAVTWTHEGSSIYTEACGAKYYLTYDSGWKAVRKSWYVIGDAASPSTASYLSADTESVGGKATCTSENEHWGITSDSESNTTRFWTVHGGTAYYLGAKEDGTLTTGSSSSGRHIDWSYTAGVGYYITLNGTAHYLTYDAGKGWTVTPAAYYLISDKAGNNYLSADKNSVSNETVKPLSSSCRWFYSDAARTQGTSTNIYRIIDGTKYYLTFDPASGLGMSTAAASWTYDTSKGYGITDAGRTYYLAFESNKWTAVIGTWHSIKDAGGTHFLSGNTDGTTSDLAECTGDGCKWQFSDFGNSGSIYFLNKGTAYYLDCNTATGALTTSTAQGTWQHDTNGYYKEIQGAPYYLTYDGGWKTVPASWRTISDGSGNYLSATETTVSNSTDASSENVRWQFSNTSTSSGAQTTIYRIIGGSKYYLNGSASGLGMSGSAATWYYDSTNKDYYVTVDSLNYHLRYNGGEWNVYDLDQYYLRVKDGEYMTVSGSTIGHSSSADGARLWKISGRGTGGTGTYSGTFSFVEGGTTCYLYSDKESVSTLSIGTSERKWSINSSNQLHYAPGGLYVTRYIRYNNGWTMTRWSWEATTLAFPQYDPGKKPAVGSGSSEVNVAYGSGSHADNVSSAAAADDIHCSVAPQTIIIKGFENIESWKTMAEMTATDVTVLDLTAAKQQVCEKEQKTGVRGGLDTIIPIKAETDDEGEYYPDYRASDKNTGYIISGGNVYDDTGISQYQKTYGDIRVTRYDVYTGNTSKPYYDIRVALNKAAEYDSSRLEILTRNVLTDGELKRIKDSHNKDNTSVYSEIESIGEAGYKALGYDAYENARNNLDDMFEDDPSGVYGLHFMNAKISMDHLVTLGKAYILGKTYEDYEMPEDSIDFQVVERGQISFFAGTYFDGNDAFFSLHQIYRDELTDKITDIKEISKVYKSQYGIAKPYVYMYTDGTYTDADGGYTGSASLPAEYEYTLAFDTEWITDPESDLWVDNAVYYFEIPCNKGEYALGSVEGKTGAYLFYLDIATNGGDVSGSLISSEGNAVTEAYTVEFRNRPDTVDYSLLQLEVGIPEGVVDPGLSDFSINVTFDNSDETIAEGGGEYDSGLYTITVVNNTGYDDPVELVVFLCDDDDDPNNKYPYAYRVIYTNADNDAVPILTLADDDYWKCVNGFIIPSSGPAKEKDFSE